ncbi:unnamed protein product [Adineta ricciae]|uniref:Uncharacterized protein n=1 Tax=Adineta ricciae TaxID=249248 RepID=A0A813UJR1_ADIRI|nr:unnamed protein product [Adineta ricciae]
MEQEVPLQANPNAIIKEKSNHKVMSQLWFRVLLVATTVKSILGLIILFGLLGLSICVFLVGFHFRQSRHCPIESKISLFLIIAGSGSIEWIVLSIILSTITIVLKHIRSFILVWFIILLALLILITNIILFGWVICGSVWTLKVFDSVQYTNRSMNTFCQQTLYHFSLGYLVMTYVLTALQCWYRLCILIFCSVQEQYGI